MIPLTNLFNLDGFKEINPILYVILILLLAGSAFFSSSETALSTVNLIKLKSLVEENKKGAKKALFLAENFEKTVSTILIGNNIVNIGFSTIMTMVFMTLIINPSLASILNTLIATIIVLIFGEVLPKQFAKQNPEFIALKCSSIIYVLKYLFFPFALIIRPFEKMVKKSDDSNKMTEDDVENLIDDLEDKGVIEEDTSDLLQGALDLSDKCVEDIMVPRVDMMVFDINDGFEALVEFIKDKPYTRYPICDGDKDKIIGKIHIKDVFLAVLESKDMKSVKIEDVMTDIIYVSETMKVDDLIETMRVEKQHMCIVSGEYGGTEGLVTMEDAIEVIFGDIYDEYDETEMEDVIQINDNTYLVSADYNIVDLIEDLELPDVDTQYSSVGGYIQEKLERMAKVGDQVTETFTMYPSGVNDDPYDVDLVFTVKEITARRIKSAIVEVNGLRKEEDEETENNEKKEE